MVFSNNYTLAYIKEVGEEDVLASVDGEEIVIPIEAGERQSLLESVSEGAYILPYDRKRNQFITTIDDPTLQQEFPEFQNEALEGADEPIPEEYE